MEKIFEILQSGDLELAKLAAVIGLSYGENFWQEYHYRTLNHPNNKKGKHDYIWITFKKWTPTIILTKGNIAVWIRGQCLTVDYYEKIMDKLHSFNVNVVILD